MNQTHDYEQQVLQQQRKWLVTGAAGFIGSNLIEKLLKLNQYVVGIDNFATGHKDNLKLALNAVNNEQQHRFKFVEADISDLTVCQTMTKNIDVVLHQAAIGSVPRSMKQPYVSHHSNVDGFAKILIASVENHVGRFIYASSSSVYGDNSDLPKIEEEIGQPLSPYAATKRIDEIYATTFAHCYGLHTIGLRYFNVFGPRQDPNGSYAAVIPKWLQLMIQGNPIEIYGDGSTSRDFCYVENAIKANLLAGCTTNLHSKGQVYNIACGTKTSLNDLFTFLRDSLRSKRPDLNIVEQPVYKDFRSGDIKHSLADITKAQNHLAYQPSHFIKDGLQQALDYYLSILS